MSANRIVRMAAAVAFLVLASACGTTGASDPEPQAQAPSTTAFPFPFPGKAPRQPVEGFGTISYRISTMPAAERCALLAESLLQRSRGLMNRTDLGGFDGMLFVWDSDSSGGFWMKDTPLPLSIAWFDASGRFVSAADMEPCVGKDSCPNYDPAGPYRYALEVPQGGLAVLGIRPGSVMTPGGPCT